jgi:hypothetical protein
LSSGGEREKKRNVWNTALAMIDDDDHTMEVNNNKIKKVFNAKCFDVFYC